MTAPVRLWELRDGSRGLKELQETEDRLLRNEQNVKKEVKKQVHDEEQKLRQQRASSLNVQKRNEISNRANQHALELQSILGSLSRASGL
jgi:hypothetical protein